VVVVGLTGGIGCGKSTVAKLLADRGAVWIDADRIAREVVEPGTDGYGEVVKAFGEEILNPDGSIDRPALGRIVFGDDRQRKRLEGIVHPRVGVRILQDVQTHRDTDHVVVLDVPLLMEVREGSASLADVIVVVAASEDVALERLEQRGLPREDAKARMAAQASLEEKIAAADHVVWNDGSLDELEKKVDELWRTLFRGRR
jgi:dephospho-CoA kinase